MITSFHLTKDDNEDISFASTCVTFGVITFDEFKAWVDYVIENSKDFPGYLLDISDLQQKFDYTRNKRKILGFTPSWEMKKVEYTALVGIGYQRWSNFESDVAPRGVALAALGKNSQVEERFRRTFPFITF